MSKTKGPKYKDKYSVCVKVLVLQKTPEGSNENFKASKGTRGSMAGQLSWSGFFLGGGGCMFF